MTYSQDGYLIKQNLISKALCDLIVTEAKLLSKPSYEPLYMPHRQPFFLAIMKLPEIVSVAKELIGDEVSGLGSEYFFHKPGTKGFSVHQDNIWVQAPPGEFIHAWIALTDINPENGGMRFYPGSHKLGPLPTEELNEDSGEGQNPGARKFKSLVPEGLQSEDILMNKGDIVFWDTYLLHESQTNNSEVFRDALLLTYIKKGAPFNPGNKQKRTEIPLC